MDLEGVRVPWRRVLLGVVVIGVVGGLTWLGWTWRHPTAFDEAGRFGHGADNRETGETFYAGMTFGDVRGSGEIVIHGGEATVVSGADIARTEVLLCTIDDDEKSWLGSLDGDDARDFCGELVPVEGQRMSLDEDDRQQVLLGVTLTEPGTVHVEDLVLFYSHGWQRGSQHIGGEIFMSTGELPDGYYH